MGRNLEISVDLGELEKSEKDLRTLASSIANRKLNITLNQAKGGTADQLKAAAAELKALASALEKLVTQTKNAVNCARSGFEEMDEQLAAWFGMTEE